MRKRSEYEDLLIFYYFGADEDRLRACRRRAYLDFNRTLRGIRANKGAYANAEKVLAGSLAAIRVMKDLTQGKFDEFHRNTIATLADGYRRDGYSKFTVGHGQKWINMTFKYMFVMGERRIAGFSHLYDFCHVPIDEYLLAALPKDFAPLGCRWSCLNNYELYLDRQQWIRNRFRKAPLDVEHELWLNEAKRRSAKRTDEPSCR